MASDVVWVMGLLGGAVTEVVFVGLVIGLGVWAMVKVAVTVWRWGAGPWS